MTTLALGLTASSGACSVAMRTKDGAVHTAPTPAAARGNDLAAQVETAFRDLGEAPTALEELRIDLGPGSYTGLRIAVTFARALHTFLEIPVLTVTSPQLLALAAWREKAATLSQRIRPVLDARRNRFHHALVEFDGGVRLAEPPRAVERDKLLQSIQQDEVLLADRALHPMLQEVAQRVACSILEPIPFGADLLFQEQLEFVTRAGEQLEPLYLMGSYAE
ncbi:MAG: tRNA (adenosine(37)-N6)-threonylcarbamoyltransferase complex dimerization subunit type 1 TsaB [Planctomycetota bacterium]|jgi:tRNA threonylcarbamoyladenosine biosynthesis protein TsaB